MFDHVTIRVSDRAASVRFYDTVLAVLDKARSGDEQYPEWDDFSIAAATADAAPPHRLSNGAAVTRSTPGGRR